MDEEKIFKILMFISLCGLGIIMSYLVIYGYPKFDDLNNSKTIYCYNSEGELVLQYNTKYGFPRNIPQNTEKSIKYCAEKDYK